MILENGYCTYSGETELAIARYLNEGGVDSNNKNFGNELETGIFQLHSIDLNNRGATEEAPLVENKEIELVTDITMKTGDAGRYHVTYHLFNEMGEAMFSFTHLRNGIKLEKGRNTLSCYFPESFFQAGQYFLSLLIVEDRRKAIFIEKDIMGFTVVNASRDLGVYMGREPGYIKPSFDWENRIV